MTVTIQHYAGGRDHEIARLVLSIQNGEAGLDLTLDDQPDLKDIGTAYASGGFWIALDGQEIVGCIGVLGFGKCGVVKKLFVSLPHRGRQGLAVGLIESALDCARALGMDRVVLDTPAAATRSHSFYAKAGFRPIAHDDLPVDYNYPDRDSLLFGLSL